MEIVTKSAKETFNLGRETGANLVKNSDKGAKIFALSGTLGSGKTTYLQGFAEGLGIKNRIISPTFILMRSYGNFYHLDLYRLEGDVEKEVQNLGLMDIWKEPGNVVAIEWAEKIKDILPKETIWVRFENIDEDRRRISI